jgi:hypothetical protein
MTLTLNLPQDLEDRLQQEAERQELPADTLILHLLDQHLPFKDIQEKLAALLRSWIVEGDPQEQKETGEYLVRALDEDRLSERRLFPLELKGRPVRPNGPEEWSPGPSPQADALGEEIDNAMRPERLRDRWSGV